MFLLDAFQWTNLLQPQWYVENGGLWLLLFVVFANEKKESIPSICYVLLFFFNPFCPRIHKV